MSNEGNGPSGTPSPDPSGTPKEIIPPVEPTADDKVLHSTHLKVLGEKKGLQTKNDDLQKKIDAFEAAEKEKTANELVSKGKFDEALKLKEEELEKERKLLTDERAKTEAHNKQMSDAAKLRSFLAAVGGDVNQKYWSLVDLEKITLDATGEPDKASVTAYATKFVEDYGNEIVSRGTKEPLPPGAPPQDTTVGNPISYVDWKNLPLKDMMKRKKDVIKT